MARTIAFSVGRMGGINRSDDTKTVQELLNQVPVTSGGPQPLLVVDGKCGPKSIAAIQKFQLHHFGWKGADGRVDPNGPTLAKLNEFDRPPMGLFSLRRVGPTNRAIDPLRSEEWFYQVSDLANPGDSAIYHFGRQFGDHRRFVTPVIFRGDPSPFQCSRQLLFLESRVTGYSTDSRGQNNALSKLALNYLADDGNVDTISILCFDDLRNPGRGMDDLPGGDPGFFFAIKSGVFQLVR